MSPRRLPSILALAAAAAACDCGGDPVLWAGLVGAPRVIACEDGGAPFAVAVGPPALDAPVRALARRRDGAVVVLQEPELCAGGVLDPVADACVPATATRVAAPPGVVVAPRGGGARIATLAGVDGGGAPLFTSAAPPWAVAEDAAGRLWVTGSTAPAVYAPGGALAFVAEALPFATRGVAPFPDGRVLVSYGVQDLALYDAAGVVTLRIEPALGAEYEGIDALAVEPGGTVLLATRRFGVGSAGVILRARIEGGALVLAQSAATSAALPGGVPSGLVLAAGRIATAPALGRLAAPACGRWVTLDLGTDGGCVVQGPHRGLAWLE